MQEVISLEPSILTILLDGGTVPAVSRWQRYSALKQQCRPYIGHEARNRTLATPAHWDALTAFLDALLPESEEAVEVQG
jgi:hypothetical protein